MNSKGKRFPVVYSSYNNYKLLEYEVLPRMRRFNSEIELIVVDDFSNRDEQLYGRSLCEREGIVFLENSKKGVIWAVDTAINYLSKLSSVRQDWVFCLQQDIFPEESYFFSNFAAEMEKPSIADRKIGAFGFNVIDEYYSAGSSEEGLMGSFFLSKKPTPRDLVSFALNKGRLKDFICSPKERERSWISYVNKRRFFSPKSLPEFEAVRKLHRGTFSIELPMWAGLAINAQIWKTYIRPSSDFIFHLWFNDIAMQLLSQNIHLAVVSNLHLYNYQEIKTKYNFLSNSADAGRQGKKSQVESYGNHLLVFARKWGFDYQSPWRSSMFIKRAYQNTLVEQYLNHNFLDGPLLDFNTY